MSEERHAVKVAIFGNEYTIRGEAEEKYIHQLAGMVDEKMKETAQHTQLNSSLKIAILAAINLADEICRLREHQTGGISPAPEAITALCAHIDAALGAE